MIFSNVSSSLVEALLSKNDDLSFVYRLQGSSERKDARKKTGRRIPEAVLSVWLESKEQSLMPMIKLSIVAQNCVFPSHVESTYTGSRETLKLAASWIKQCNDSHKKCLHLKPANMCLPTRLIDVGTADGKVMPHLWIPEKTTVAIPYMTLSYRWGMSPKVLLTRTSLPELCKQIPVDLLPQSNQDAIHITRSLGIRYLWIDALCIIQDREEDFHLELAKMRNIYKNSYCTISASQGETGERGCFSNRQPLQADFGSISSRIEQTSSPKKLSGKHIQGYENESASRKVGTMNQRPAKMLKRHNVSDTGRESGGTKTGFQFTDVSKLDSSWKIPPTSVQMARNSQFQNIDFQLQEAQRQMEVAGGLSKSNITIRTLQKDLWSSEVDASPLSRRAWTLQERLLSSRILHFTRSQLFWECQTAKACEAWPQPVVKNIVDKRGADEMTEFDHGKTNSSALSGSALVPIKEHWDEIVELYTDGALTKPEDKLVAMSGLATEALEDTEDTYHAGLWRNDFARSLLWYLITPQHSACTAYRAPTWSWASVDGKVAYLARRPDPEFPVSELATIEKVQTLGVDGERNPTGQIKYGLCRISGPLRQSVRYEKHGNIHRLILSEELSNHQLYADFFPDVDIENEPSDLICLPMLYHQETRADSENKGLQSFMSGLVVRPSGEFLDEYRRVGVFRIPEESGRAWFEEEVVIKEISIV
ncbi:hypothetical protein LSUE1_G002663 [Lachnellula suecica]|uniref:Heterokaryon incompatibility domain-containing protein n=1 Tax=Lachnellula suecica TaxID=602035 RepID=A0A8T9CG06_9HELO|nr:hypothetical protein LSUE1_G002663 [Lachnellula suecica]